jgi:thiol-disulfide isomerase/thioredoxin
VAALVVAGCAAGSTSAGAPATPGSPFSTVGSLPKTLDGASLDTSSLAGKPVVLWFWAPWCTFCREEAPAVDRVAREFSGRVAVIGVAGQDTLEAMRAFVESTGTGHLTHLADVSGSVWRDYGVSVQPAFAFIAPDGRAQLRVGSLDEASLRARVAELASGAQVATAPTSGGTCSRAPDGTLYCGAAGPSTPTSTTPGASQPPPTSAEPSDAATAP